MATLTGTTIQSTYDSLLKVTDNDAITSSLKRITDGLGNNTPLFLSNTAVEISSGLNVVGSITGANLSGTNTGDETKSSIETKLGAASASNSGYLTSSDWSTFNNKIAGLGTLNRVAKFSSTGSIADSNITDNGILINISTATTIAGDLTATNIIRAGGNSSQFLKANGSVDSTSYTPTSRTLTINGTTFDLTADRSWTITAGVSGSGTPSRIAMFTSGSTVIGNSQIFQSIDEVAGTMIGIGGDPNAAPILSRLYVNGTSYMAGSITATGAISTSESITASFIVRAGGTAAQLLAANGSVVTAGTNITISGGTISATSGGITSLNGLTGATQTFATGTSGADFNISSTGTTHTFNIPTASSSTRGLLSAADWVIFANRISGSGTTNFVPKFNGATSLTNSLIFDNGTNVGINTTSPTERLHVVGNGLFSGSLTAGGDIVTPTRVAVDTINGYTGGSTPITIQTGGAQAIVLGTSATERMRITSGGNVGIGTTSPTDGRLQVAGNTQIGNTICQTFFGVAAYSQWITSGGAFAMGLDGAAGTTERMRITSAGNVGINTTAPNSTLDVNGIAYLRSDLRFGADYAGSNTAIFKWQGSGAAIPNSLGIFTWGDARDIQIGGSNVLFRTESGSERMRITSGGNVGIGTSSPGYALEVSRAGNSDISATSTIDSGAAILSVFNSAGGSGNFAQFRAYGNTTGGTLFGSSTNKMNSIWSNNDNLFTVGTIGATPLVLGTSNTERMRITSGGNVGIGTTSPQGRFDVVGNIGGGGIVRLTDSATECSIGYRINGSTGSTGWVTGNFNNDFFMYSFTSGTQVMTLKPTGNVGIGQTNPSARLAIDGGGLLVNTNGTISANCTASFRARTGTATDRTLEAFSISYSALFYLQNNGSYFFAGSNLSDARAKKDITYFNEPILDKVMQLKPASFRYTENDENIKGGFIAQEVKEIFPDLVTKTESEDDLMGVDYYGVIALLTKAVQELKQEIEELKNK